MSLRTGAHEAPTVTWDHLRQVGEGNTRESAEATAARYDTSPGRLWVVRGRPTIRVCILGTCGEVKAEIRGQHDDTSGDW